ncbi:hypothetical protein [Flavivirga sp. 57AJ16]|uniref:hypothetical protein n=1 Tax=Flavivirga sp. 57AJ16 TaxID=3025307 RepID=UPI0023669225|nr:hypothetical protein [Flavivirga sp. 57AJ16]MDD7885434.1 hypothetical protein [Flavivirga sp. 57AJ16]
MKHLKLILFTLLIMTFSISYSYGQEIEDKMKTTKVNTFHFDNGDEKITYKVKVIEKRKSATMGSETVDPNLEHVAKLISIDNDTDNSYDKYLVLRYKKMPEETFKLVETKKGFAIIVNGKTLEYLVGEGTYVTNNKDSDYFLVDEFNKF